jgi:hypothetical protein
VEALEGGISEAALSGYSSLMETFDALDLSTDAGKEAFKELVAEAETLEGQIIGILDAQEAVNKESEKWKANYDALANLANAISSAINQSDLA